MAKEPKEQPKEKAKTSLNEEELKVLSQILYNSKWTGREWQGTVIPLISKLSRMVDEAKIPPRGK